MLKRLIVVCSVTFSGLTPLWGSVDVEICLREQLSNDTYPHTILGETTGVSVRAFGLDPTVPIEEWRETPTEELVDLFEAYITEHNIADAGRYVLDFEKDWAHTVIENREIIERSIEAVRLVKPGVDISLFGTPFVPANGNLSPIFSDADYLEWVQGLGIGYIPVLYIRADDNGNFPSLEEVERSAELSLSVFPANESTPFLWHKWKNGGNWMTNPDIVDTFPNLDPLRIQLDVIERLGITNTCFWHGDNDPAITEMLEILFTPTTGDFDDDGDVDGADFLKWQRGESPNSLSAEDLAAWEVNFGTPASPLSAVPEPASALLLGLGCLLLLSSYNLVAIVPRDGLIFVNK